MKKKSTEIGERKRDGYQIVKKRRKISVDI